jgi:hypothetical protein
MINRGRLLLRLMAVMAIAASVGWSAPSVGQTKMTCPTLSFICNVCPANKQAACTTQCRIVGGSGCFGIPQNCSPTGEQGCSPSSPSLLCVCSES